MLLKKERVTDEIQEYVRPDNFVHVAMNIMKITHYEYAVHQISATNWVEFHFREIWGRRFGTPRDTKTKILLYQ